MQTTQVQLISRVRALLSGRLQPRPPALSAQNEELLYEVGRTRSPDELLVKLPKRIVSDFRLSSFQIFLPGNREYVLQGAPGQAAEPRVALPASCSTVSHLRRDRRPAMFLKDSPNGTQPEPWQMLATPREIEVLASLGAGMLVPLEGRTGLVGFVTLGRVKEPAFSRTEMEFFSSLGAQMGRGLETVQLITSLNEEAVRRARSARELELAREVQERLLPGELPVFAGMDMAASYKSADEVGGDYYDLFVTEAGHLCGVVADISGHGVSSALLMAALRASLHSLMLDTTPPPEVMVERLGRLLFRASSMSRYATFFFFLYDPATFHLTYVNAGHNPPILQGADGTVTRLVCGGPVLGLLPDAKYEHGSVMLGVGDSLIAYTDGVTEACNAENEEWGEEGLLGLVDRMLGSSAQEKVTETVAALTEFAAGAPQSDDITLLVVQRVGY